MKSNTVRGSYSLAPQLTLPATSHRLKPRAGISLLRVPSLGSREPSHPLVLSLKPIPARLTPAWSRSEAAGYP